MSSCVSVKTYKAPPVCEKEILRYALCKESNDEISLLMHTCLKEAEDKFSYKVCYRELNVSVCDDVCDFELFSVKSKNLASNLKGCKKVILFIATVGIEIDRLIAKYGHTSPSKAVTLQAIGAERVEALCDMFCLDISKEMGASLRPRFSAGYGDLPLETQKDIFISLSAQKNIGVFLNDSLLMSPSKSVSAFVGVEAD